MKVIGLIDCNNFFVSCERAFRPELMGRPVAVLSSNDGCIVARSEEVKDIGIPMGAPLFKVKDMIKDNNVTVLSGNITLYRDMSRRVFEVLRSQYQVVEQYSIDECFFEVHGSETVANLVAQLRQMRELIKRQTGIPVSIGIAASKTLAKCAAATAKTANGVFYADAQWVSDSVHPLGLQHIWGVGAGLSRQFASASLHRVSDVVNAYPERVRQLFGINGAKLQCELRGVSALPVTTTRPLQKSLMNSRSFRTLTNDLAILHDAAAYHTRHIAAELRAMQAGAGAVRVVLQTSRHGDWFMRGGSQEHTLVQPTNDTMELLRVVQATVQVLHEPDVPYQKVLVAVSQIAPLASATQRLLTDHTSADTSGVLAVVDRLNTRADRELITIGTRYRTQAWQPKSANRSPAYTTRWSDIPTAVTQSDV
jgi:DNA polymerase V